MGKLLSFPKHQEKYSGAMLNAMMKHACEIVDTSRSTAMLYSADRCCLDVPVIGDPTGQMGVTCNAPMYYLCIHCGPLCVNCMEEYACCGPTGKHEEDNILDDGA